MKIQFNQHKYNYYKVANSTAPSFRAHASTMQGKLNVILSETKKIYNTKQNIELKNFEAIIKKISPTTSVRLYSQIPPGSNISPRTGAYFSQKTNINPYTNEINVDDKVIYLNFSNQIPSARLKLFGDFIHEATHIAQEESSDRYPTIDFVKTMVQSRYPTEVKSHSLVAGVQSFKHIEYNVLLPLIDGLRKSDDIPEKIIQADKNILNIIYENKTGLSTVEYIKAVTKNIINQLKTNLPSANDNYILQYICKKAGQEKEAYKISLNFLKDILKINGATDLDLRILLYDEFEKTVKEMIK